MVMWWERVGKVYIKKFFMREGTVNRQEGTDGKLLLRLSLCHYAVPDPTRGKKGSV